jgi:hypothetical protein
VTRAQIVKRLRQGLHPEQFGACSLKWNAYRLGAYVIKHGCYFTCGPRTATRRLRRQSRMRIAPTVTVRKRGYTWRVQRYYASLTQTQESDWYRDQYMHSFRLDLHTGNVGRDARGRLVAFDW